MKKLRRIFFLLICFWILALTAADQMPRAYAASTMSASEACVEFIKKAEGFSAKPYYDYQQHTVGYGTKCPTDKYFDYMVNGISKEDAEALLHKTLADVADAIQQKLIDRYGLTFTQHQFDALVSFTFNLGTSWMTYDSTLRNAILRNANEDDLLYAFGLYCTAGGSYSSGLINRRLCEANMYLNGVYSQKVSDAYGYVFYEPNGGSLTYQVQGFVYGNHTAPAADAVRRDDVFLGWYTDLTGGSQVKELSRELSGKTLFARWQSSQNYEIQDSVSRMIRVTGDVVNIRKGPGTIYGIAKQVYCNDHLLVSHVTTLSNRSWGKVQDGWICLEYTDYDDVINGAGTSDTETNQPPVPDGSVSDSGSVSDDDTADTAPDNQQIVSGIVRVNDLLRIRSGPGMAHSTVGYLFNGQQVEILEQKTADALVWGRMARGWVCMNYIATDMPQTDPTTGPDQEDTEQPEPDQTEPPEQEVTESAGQNGTAMAGKIIADALRIRSGPGTENAIVGFYYQNDLVTVSEKVLVQSVPWGKTDKGWINMNYVLTGGQEEDVAPPPEKGTMTVIADCLRVRKAIGTDSRISELLYYGDTVEVFETQNVGGTLWGRVHNGWICMDYVQ